MDFIENETEKIEVRSVMNALLEIKNVTKYFGSGDAVSNALNGVRFAMERGEFTAVMGASGSGKSTLLNVIATIERPGTGSILLEGRDISELCRTRIGRNLMNYINDFEAFGKRKGEWII